MIINGKGIPLVKDDIDTDQIIPAEYCFTTKREDFSEALFGRWRKEKDFILNNKLYSNASILVVGKSFATGSSREYAAWAIKDYGFEVIIAENFGEIFYKNAIINKILPLKMNYDDIKILWKALKNNCNEELTVDVNTGSLYLNEAMYNFHISDFYLKKYLSNEDDITLTLKDTKEIEKFEKHHLHNLIKVKRGGYIG